MKSLFRSTFGFGFRLGLLVLPAGTALGADDLVPLPGEAAMAAIVTDHPDQERPFMTHNEVLQFVARRKAEDMADRAYFAHVDPDGFAANFVAGEAGYHLPYSTVPSVNSIESIGVRHQNNISAAAAAQIVFDAWMESPLHKSHVLAESAGYVEQTSFAVGYAYLAKGPFNYSSHYFVFVSAPPDGNAAFGPYARWRFRHLTLPQMNDASQDADGDGITDPFEYAYDTDPLAPDSPPLVVVDFDRATGMVRMTHPFRMDLDESLEFSVVRSNGPVFGGRWVWENTPFDREGFAFTVGTGGERSGFFRLIAERR